MSKNHESILRFLERPIAFHPILARISRSVNAGLFLSQLLYWTPRGKDKDGWIYKTQKEWEEETCLSRREQETARAILKRIGILHEKRIGQPAALHYKIDMGALFSLAESDNLEWMETPYQTHKTANLDAQMSQSTIAETTSEITTEITTADPAPPLPEFPFPEFIKEYQNQRLKAFRTLPRIPLKELDQARETLTDYGITDEQAVEYAKALGAKWRSEDVKFWPVSLLKFDGALLARLDKERVVEEMEDADLMSEMKRLFPGWVPKSERTA